MSATAETPVDLDSDSPPLKAALARLCRILSGQLDKAAEAIEAGQCGAWQACGFMHRLDKLRVESEFLLKDCRRLQPLPDDDSRNP